MRYTEEILQTPFDSNRRPASEMAADWKTLLGAGTIDDDVNKQVEFFASRRFPDDEKAIDRYAVGNDGRVYYKADDGEYYAEVPKVEDVQTFLQSTLYSTPDALAAAPAIATGIVTAPMWAAGPGGAAVSAGATTLASAAGSYTKELLGNWIADDPINHGRVATTAALDVAGEGIGTKIGMRHLDKAFEGRGKDVLNAAPYESPNPEPGVFQSNVKDSLTTGQRTDNAQIIGMEDAARQNPASRDIMARADDARTVRIQSEVDRFMSEVFSPVSDLDAIGRIAKETAETGAELDAKNMANRARPFYERAFQSGQPLDTTPITDALESRLSRLRNVNSGIVDGFQGIQNLFFGKDKARLSSIEELHYVKKELDHLLDKGSPAYMGRAMEATLADTKKQLVALLKQNGDYAKASKIYEDLYPTKQGSEVVNGMLSRIKDAKLHQIAVNLLSEGASPTSINQAKRSFLLADPSGESWNMVIRGFLQHNLEKAATKAASGNAALTGGKFASRVLGNAFIERNMRAAMTPRQFKGLQNLVYDLRQSAKGVPANSATYSRQQAEAEMARRSTPFAKRMSDRFDLQNPLKIIVGSTEKLATGNGWVDFANLVTSPEGLQQLEKIAGLSRGTLQSRVAMAQLLSSFAADWISDPSAEDRKSQFGTQ